MTTLPLELWQNILRFATLPDVSGASRRRYQTAMCHKETPRMVKISWGGETTRWDAHTQMRTKCALALVCKDIRRLSMKYLYETLIILDENVEDIANLVDSPDSGPVLRSSARKIIIAMPKKFKYENASNYHNKRTAAIIRVISSLQNVEAIEVRINLPETHEIRILRILPPTIKHLEWRNFNDAASRLEPTSSNFVLTQFIHGIRHQIESLCVSGHRSLFYSGVPFSMTELVNNADSEKRAIRSLNFDFPALKQLYIGTSWYKTLRLDNYAALQNLTCLSLELSWLLPNTSDPPFNFFKGKLPGLQCLHLGAARRHNLIPTVLNSTVHLACLDYKFFGESDIHFWDGIEHHCLTCIVIRLYAAFDRSHFLPDHLRPFSAVEYLRKDGQPVNFNSLKCLKFIILTPLPAMLDGYERKKEELKSCVCSIMLAATPIRVELVEESEE